jgi:hypothetical protein
MEIKYNNLSFLILTILDIINNPKKLEELNEYDYVLIDKNKSVSIIRQPLKKYPNDLIDNVILIYRRQRKIKKIKY